MVSRVEGDKWHVLALAAQKAVQSDERRDYEALRPLCDDLERVPVLGRLTTDNACVLLKRGAVKASYAARPDGFAHGLTEASAAVIVLYEEAFGV